MISAILPQLPDPLLRYTMYPVAPVTLVHLTLIPPLTLDADVSLGSDSLLTDLALCQSPIVLPLYALTVYVYVVPLAAVVSV